MSTILIIDDDDQLRKSFLKLLFEEGYLAQGAASGEAGLELIQSQLPDLVIVDIRLPGMNGLETFEAIHALEPKLPVIIMTAFGTTETAIEATKMGAFDYILKPFEIPDMLAVIKQALEAGRFMRTPVQMDVAPETASQEAIVGRSKSMQNVYKAIGRVSSADATVLIRGESGTGKELVARAIHSLSLRKKRALVKVNCATLPSNLIESELFGHEKGAFTGSHSRHIGRFEIADGTTIFLDEIGELPLELQPKLLRVIQDGEFERLGSSRTIKVDSRIIAATNRNLEEEVRKGRFRDDLWYRLNIFPITMPPLRDRMEDIPLLVDFYIKKISKRLGKTIEVIPVGVMTTLQNYHWPGNVRELENVLERAVINSSGPKLHLVDELKKPYKDLTRAQKTLDEVERDYILRVLEQTRWKVSGKNGASEILELDRSTLRARMRKLGIVKP